MSGVSAGDRATEERYHAGPTVGDPHAARVCDRGSRASPVAIGRSHLAGDRPRSRRRVTLAAMVVWHPLLVMTLVASLGCGRHGFDPGDGDGDAPGPPDYTPDAIAWPDFDRLSTAPRFTGINRSIEVEVTASYAVGSPSVQYRVDSGDWNPLPDGAPQVAVIAPDATLQFRVGGAVGDSAFITATNVSTGGTLLDTTQGTVTTLVTGDGTGGSPYAAPDVPPASCRAFLDAYPEQAGRDGLYRVQPAATALDLYCDMTRDSGGWTLVARVLGTDTTHTTAAAIGSVTSPTQGTLGKLSDAQINSFTFMHARVEIETVGTVYARVTSVNLTATPSFSIPNAAATSFAGQYTLTLGTATGCAGDCGVFRAIESTGFGQHCGYRYWSSAGSPRPGMGCQGNVNNPGRLWIR